MSKSFYFSTCFIGLLTFCLFVPSANADESSNYYEKAVAEVNQENYEAAYIQLKNSLKLNPANLPAQILMGKVLMISGYMEESEEILEEALLAGADPSLVADTLGKVWLYSKQYDKIKQTRFQGLSPQAEVDWMLIVATANLNTNDTSGARKGYEKALALQPRNVRALNALASLEILAGDLEKAQAYLDRSFAQDMKDPTTWRLQGDFFLAKEFLDEATRAYNTSYDIAPDDPLIKRSLVQVYMQKRDIPAAQNLLENVLSQTPSDPTGLLLNAWLLSQREQSDQAATELEKLSSKLGNLTEEQLRQDPSLIYVSGLSAFAQQNYQQAKTSFEQYLNFVPSNTDAIALLAQAYIKLGQPKPALEAMQRQERKLAEQLDYAVILSELYLANDKAFKAVELIDRLKERYPNSGNVQLLEIKALIARDKLQEALDKLNAHPLATRSVSFILTKCRLLIQMREYDQASTIINELLDASPSNEEYLNIKSAIQMNQRQWSEALVTVEQILSANPVHFAARYSKANILIAQQNYQDAKNIAIALSDVREDDVTVLMLLARANAGLKEYEDAISRLERVLEKDIDNLQAMEIKAAIHVQMGDLEKAIRQFGSAIRTAPEQPRYHMKRVELMLANNQVERARREFKEIADLIATDPVLLSEFSRIQMQAEDPEGAQESITKAYQLMPNSPSLAIRYIRLHLATKNLAAAQKVLNSWLKKFPTSEEFLILSGDLAIQKQQNEQASKAYLKALEYTPSSSLALAKLYQTTKIGVGSEAFEEKANSLLITYPDYHLARNLLADYYLDQNRFDEALQRYTELLEVDNLSNRAVILNNVANIYLERDLKKAKTFIEQAIEIDNGNPSILDTHGWILAKQGDIESALNVLRRAYAMDSDQPANLYHLAYTLSKLNRKDEAKQYAEKALQNDTRFAEREATMALLETL